MRQTIDSTHPFWKHVHPPEQGWLRCYETWFDEDYVKFAFRCNGHCRLVLQCTKEAYVSRLDVARAANLRKLCMKMHPGTHVQVVMAYGRLLMPPARLPTGIEVVSVTVESEERAIKLLRNVSTN